jgi:hypothetical protein
MKLDNEAWGASDRLQGRYFLWFDGAALLFVLASIAVAAGVGHGVAAVLGGASQLILLGLLPRRRDEFAEHCWRRATRATFTALLLVPLVWSFAFGIYAGFVGKAAPVGAPTSLADVPSTGVLLFALFATFFASFEWMRFRGAAA